MTGERRIYHITHVGNLPGIVAVGGLWCDSALAASRHAKHGIGMSTIKTRRLTLPVSPHPGTHVGDYVPFYFCPRCIMLYVIHCGNHPELTYRGGQGPIVHLSAPLDMVIDWAEREGRPWAFSFSNAGAYYTRFSARRSELDQLDWQAIGSIDFRAPEVKEAKQAELLVHEFFPVGLFDEVGVMDRTMQARAHAAFSAGSHCPLVRIRPDWYY